MMSRSRRPLVIGNWKMNGLRADLATIQAIDRSAATYDRVEAVLCPPHTLVAAAVAAVCHVAIGGQDCHAEASGPHTGAVSAAMLADAGARYVILGHSERRHDNLESDALIAAKAGAALRAQLVPVICVGEAALDRPLSALAHQVADQMLARLPVGIEREEHANIVIAYEPSWAIGSANAPPMIHASAISAALRERLAQVLPQSGADIGILYGGAVDAANARTLLRATGAQGLLLGRSSLTAEAFLAVTRACRAESD